MNIKKLLPALMLGCAFAASADGYTDGIEYYKAGQYANAKTILERNINAPSTDKALSYYYLGQIAIVQGDQATAAADFQKGIEANADCAYNYIGLGALALQKGDVKTAEDYFKTAQKFAKKNTEVLVDIARAYYRVDKVKYDKKIHDLLAKAHKESKNTEPSIYILEGDMIFDQMNPDLIGDAAAQYEMAISFDQDNPEGYVKYANAYIGVNPQYSISKLEELLQKQPTSALAQRELAELYYTNNLWTKAAELYGKYIQNPNHFPEDKARYAVLLYANKDYEKSLKIAEEILADNPGDFVMLRIRMLDLAELDRNEEAVEAAQTFFALPLKGDQKYSPIDYNTYGNVLSKLERPEMALEMFEKGLALDPTRGDNWKAISSSYAEMAKYQEAAEAFDQYVALADNPTLTDYYQLAAQWLRAANGSEDPAIRLGNADKGLVAMQRVLDAVAAGDASPNPAFLQRQGLLYFVRNNMVADDATADVFTKLLEMLDADPANVDPTNASNKIPLYKQAYTVLIGYYNDRDPQKAKAFSEMLNALP